MTRDELREQAEILQADLDLQRSRVHGNPVLLYRIAVLQDRVDEILRALGQAGLTAA